MLAIPMLVVALAGAPLLTLPDDASSIATVRAGGVQVYRCAASSQTSPMWTLERPAATLYRDDASVFGTHGAGPSWMASDGSAIVADGAKPIARLPQPTAVPWLALRVVAQTGSGILTGARYVERYDTAGGLEPDPKDCTPDRIGTVRAIQYSAIYEFFR